VEITEKGEALKEQALSVPAAVASCIDLPLEDAKQLHRLLYRLLGTTID